MSADRQAGFLALLADADGRLHRVAQQSETEIAVVARVFKNLAGQAETVLQTVGAIVDCAEKGTGTGLAQVRSLCVAVRVFLEQRLEAATTILRALESEEKLLRKLTQVMQRQEAVASQLKALSVLTNVEVSQLGSMGGDFHLLASELAAFSNSVSTQTRDLASHTRNSQRTIAESRRELAVDLPRLRGEMVRMDRDLGKTMQAIDAGLSELAVVPAQFKFCAEQTLQQIAGVVAAIQAHDITRQQIEHVQQSFEIIGAQLAGAQLAGSQFAGPQIAGSQVITWDKSGSGNANAAPAPETDGLPIAYAGLTIQICQLKTIQQIVGNWTSQVRRCMGGIQQLSASQVAQIGTLVVNQERDLSAQLARIERLQQESQDYGRTIQCTLGGLSNLLELVNESLGQSQEIRHRLRFLTFNSIVEANRLGRQGVVVSGIANLIKGVSAEWNVIADESGIALGEIRNQVQETNQVMEVFSEASSEKLRADQRETRAALSEVRDAAVFVAKEAARVQEATERMRNDTERGGNTGDRLDRCAGELGRALDPIEAITRRLEADDPEIAGRSDRAEVEELFSAFYTTEVERSVLQAALEGTPLPVLEESFAGNEVELF
jgi:hypothetical protein